jgi:di/tricarboxylate transporter
MPAPITAIAIFIVVFAVATVRKVHLGILMFPTACAVGVLLAGMPLREVVGGFPLNIMVLLAGVTYFFGIAQVNGTIDRLIGTVVAHAGSRPVVLPFVFFGLAGAVAAMGSPQGGLVLAPVGMPVARRSGMDPVLMSVAINAGISSGGFAPTSLFGIVTYRIAHEAGIDLNPFTLLAVVTLANLALVIAALVMFGKHRGRAINVDRLRSARTGTTSTTPDTFDVVSVAPSCSSRQPSASSREDQPITSGAAPEVVRTVTGPRLRLERRHIATITCMIGLVVSVIACAVSGIDPDIGVIAFGFGALLALIDPKFGALAFPRIDWSTVFMVGGIVTFVGVLQKMGSVNLLGQSAMTVGTPLVAALLICAIAGLVSAFASTTGILAALVPLAVPLATSGDIAGWALICALGACASIVDVSPFSTTGATLIASAAEDERPRLRVLLTRWGMSMVVVGPVVLVPLLVIPM